MPQAAPATERREPKGIPLGGAVSLEWKLPLLMTALLAAGLAAMLAFTYVTLRSRAETIVRNRLSSAVAQVAGGAAASMAQRAQAMHAVAADSAVARVLRAHGAGESVRDAELRTARAALQGLLLERDTDPVELWDADRRVVAFTGAGPAVGPRIAPADAAWAAGPADSVRIGPLHAAGERVRFWLLAPVLDGGRRLGFVARPLHVGSPPGALQMLRDFVGEEFTLYTRNADGSFWASAPGRAAARPARRDSTARGVTYVRPGVGRLIAAEAPVAGTPWVMVLESPESWIVQRPRTTIRQMALVSLVIVALGTALAWTAGRRLARPLSALTAAAEGVARGRYDTPVAGRGRDEVGRLAASFDAMARQVDAARRELEGRVADAQRARAEAEHARAEAELASRAKSDFLAVMSHELRTPLNAIGGYTQLLEMGLHGPVTEAQKQALERIQASQAHLLALIDDLLSFARIDAGQVQYALADVPLDETLAELEALIAPQVAAVGLRFQLVPCGPGVAARADRDKLRQLLLNLLANALKYTPAGGSVRVECEVDERQVRVHVRDTGTGIRAERLPYIFEPFVQGERALNRPDEGVGLGLAISRELARGMGGELTVESRVGHGSTFTVTLPRAGAESAVPDAQEPASAASRI
ncbi:MAG TPA: HAMP domain-containing sensor histidine kinase [Longimicrobium sp.]|nr:HAMP domain-containing sensor histidine kinase [Longimicrobium sp.]